MAKKIFNIETGYDMVGKMNVDPAASNTINTCMWFTLDASGNAIVATTTHRLVYFCSAGMERPDVYDSVVSGPTGSITGCYGNFVLEVDSNGYDTGGTYALDTALKIDSGKLVDGTDGTDIIVGRALGAVADGKLRCHINCPVVVADI